MTAPSMHRREWRLVGNPAVVAGVIGFLLFPWLPFVSFSVMGTANLAAYYALVAVSLVVLTGWVGQISLGHAGLVGVGAYVTGHVINGWHVTFPVNLLWAGTAGGLIAIVLGVVAVRVRGLYLAVATIIFSWTASEFLFRQRWFTRNGSVEVAAFGEPGTFPYFDFTSRRTYFYAAWAVVAAAIYLVANLRDSKTGRAFFAVRGSEVAAASLGISVARTKLVAFAVSGALAGMAGNLLLVRDQVVSPDAFRVEVSLFFLAVAVVGGLSSLGGAVAAALLFAALNEVFFRVALFSGWLEVVPPVLLTLVLLLYRGGLAAIPAALAVRFGPTTRRLLAPVLTQWGHARASMRPALDSLAQRVAGVRAALAEKVTRIPRPWRSEPPIHGEPSAPTAEVTSDRLDLARLLGDADDAIDRGADDAPTRPDDTKGHRSQWNGHAAPTSPSASGDAALPPRRTWQNIEVPAVQLPDDRDERPVLISVDDVTVQFGGLVAAKNVRLTVRQNEIVGLIGPNGAGKTTTFNAIAGLNVPAAGRVWIYGNDVTPWPVDRRARLGVARTFQAIQLLPQLSVFDNLLVATHVQNPSRLLSHLFIGPATLAAETDGRRQVRLVAELLELDEHLDRLVADLPFGVLRLVEVARALVTGARLLMLDEPASGLDNTETDRLADLLRFVRNLGVTLLLIEHDVPMVTSVSDYIYVLDHGELLAEGTADEIKANPSVVAAYLGSESTDEAPTAPATVVAAR